MVGVRSSKAKERSGRTVTRAGIGVPVVRCAVRALNSWGCELRFKDWRGRKMGGGTLQKSMLFTPLLPRAGPTGGLGDAWPAPTMSLTIWSFWMALRAILVWWLCRAVGRGCFLG